MNLKSNTSGNKKPGNPESTNLYKSLFENVHDGIYQSTPEGKIITANPALVKMLGYDTVEELLQLNIAADIYCNPADRDHFLNSLKNEGKLKDVELNLKTKSGKKITVLENSYPVYDSGGRLLFFEGTLVDITLRKEAEEALRESETRYHTLVETTQDGISLIDLHGRFIYSNQRMREMLGYDTDGELKQTTTFELIHPEDKIKARGFFEELLEKGCLRNREIRFLRKDGTWFWTEFHANLFTGADGQPKYIMDTMRDITERRRTEEELRLRLIQLRQIIDLVPAYLFAKDQDGIFLLANKALAEMFGLQPEEIVGKTDRDYGATEEQIEWYRHFDLKAISEQKTVYIPEEKVLRKDGTEGWFQTVKIPYKHPGYEKNAVLGVAMDITERKKILDELKRSEERFRKLFEAHSSVMLIIDPDTGEITDANKAASKFYGWDLDKLKRLTIYDINTATAESIRSRILNVVQSGETRFEAVHRLADRTTREVEVFSSVVESENKKYLYSIIHDISEKKRILADLTVAKEKAEESDRLKTAFLHNISHEIRTPMNAIVGFASLLSSENLLDETSRNYTEMIIQGSRQLLSIISDIVEISNIETGRVNLQYSEFDINKIISSLAGQYSIKASRSATNFRTKIPSGENKIFSDETRVIQIVSNLLDNAFKFTPEGGRVELRTKKQGKYAHITVSDNGPGIEAEFHEKIFERFYQIPQKGTDKTGGTGLGLAICKAYAELLGYEILLKSAPGEGSEFTLKIPLHATREQVRNK